MTNLDPPISIATSSYPVCNLVVAPDYARSAMVSQFCVRPTSKRGFWKVIQVTMKYDLFDVM
jgi:hypothetical protein